MILIIVMIVNDVFEPLNVDYVNLNKNQMLIKISNHKTVLYESILTINLIQTNDQVNVDREDNDYLLQNGRLLTLTSKQQFGEKEQEID